MGYVVNESQMKTWELICKTYAEKEGAELLFVNDHSCGLEYPNGTLSHVSIEDMIEKLGLNNEQGYKKGRSEEYDK